MSHARTLWEEGREPGRQIVVLGIAVALTAVALDLWITGHLSLLFDLGFVVLCVGLALAVRPTDFFTVGVLPPLLMVGVFAMLGVVSPTAVAEKDDSVIQAVVSGLATHAGALIVGYALCLATLATRQRFLARSRPPTVQASKRLGSPAP
ncbi:conserved membrane hypothetical protein [metagenome]|uniref:DUF6542 domain-containing protein n=1 Tax=metagenome TaxID=256318 RepID=A0A2P2BZN1_9ZZZZ